MFRITNNDKHLLLAPIPVREFLATPLRHFHGLDVVAVAATELIRGTWTASAAAAFTVRFSRICTSENRNKSGRGADCCAI